MEAIGHTIHVVCPDKNAGDLIETSLHDFEGDQTYTAKLGHYVLINITFSDTEKQLDQYDAVYCAGGGPEYIRTDRRVQAIVRHLHETKKPLFTICHGFQILVAVDGAVRGKKVGALAACEPEVTLAGGTYIDLSPTEAYVDGTMVSAKGWTALAAFIRECLKVLGGNAARLSFSVRKMVLGAGERSYRSEYTTRAVTFIKPLTPCPAPLFVLSSGIVVQRIVALQRRALHELFSGKLFPVVMLLCLLDHHGRHCDGNHHRPIIVGDDDVAGDDCDTAAGNRNVDGIGINAGLHMIVGRPAAQP